MMNQNQVNNLSAEYLPYSKLYQKYKRRIRSQLTRKQTIPAGIIDKQVRQALDDVLIKVQENPAGKGRGTYLFENAAVGVINLPAWNWKLVEKEISQIA